MIKYRITIKFTKLAIPNIVEFDNKSLAEQYQKFLEGDREQEGNPNIVWTTLEEVKA